MVSRLQGKLQSGEHVPDSSHRAHRRIGLAILPAAHHAHFCSPSIDVSDRSPGPIERLRAGSIGLHRPLARGLAALCIVASSAGCLLTRDLPDPALDIPDAYKAARLKDPGSTPKLDWWRGFRSSELTMLMEEAQTVNLDIAAAVARFQQADAQARIAGAALLPSLSGSGQETYSRTSGASASGLTIGGREVVNYSASLSASYELDFAAASYAWSALGATHAAPGHQTPGSAARFRHRQCRQRPRAILSQHPVDRAGRLSKFGPGLAFPAARSLLQHCRQPDTAHFRGWKTYRQLRVHQSQAG